MSALPPYAELHCRSNFSFLVGASHPEELVARAHELGYAALAITDEGSLAGVVRAHGEAERLGLKLIVGAEMRLAPPPDQPDADEPRLVLLAQTRRGYGNLAHWITVARRRAAKGEYLAWRSDLEGAVPTAPFLAGLPGCIALLLPDPGQPLETVFAHASWLKTWFGPERAAVALELLHHADDADLADTVTRVAAQAGLPVVAAGGVLMHTRSRKPLLDVLTATRLKRPVAECGFELEPNAEAHLRPRARLAALYRPEWLAATLAVAERCSFSLAELKYEYPREIVPEGHTPTSWLRELTESGARRRFPAGVPDAVRAQIEHELALIARLGYEPYFLTVADIVHWARDQDILCQGRGSAANSAVCYCLEVTAVDPSKSTLLFERFISEERNEPPDIDIDFEHQKREHVIQYVYRKYGRHRAALTAVVISYRPRSALRDVGRALGLDLDRIESVARGQQWFDGRRIDPERLREQGLDPAAPLCRLWVELTEQLIGFPRHLSQHPGGFVIARDELSQLVPVENAAMEERSVVQWDKDDLDALGLMKVDLLALGMLSAIRRALDFVGAKRGAALALHQIPQDEKTVYDMLSAGDSIGVFQVESRAQMSMLPRLKPQRFYDLVIEVAIVRPGPIQGGMVHPYLKRRCGEEPVDYPSAEVRQALERTLGVPIFQEQVMQLAILAADFTPGEADRLRRAMAAWKRKGGLGPFHERLVGRMVAKGYTAEFAERIFKQIEGFGEYGFPESHAASFALLVYASAWLKRHHPDAFLAALLNSQPMGFYAPAQLVRDAREHGVVVRPVDVFRSDWATTLEDEAAAAGAPPGLRAVRLGFSRVTGFPQDAAERLVAARTADGAFASAEDLARRARLDRRELALLADAGALVALAGHRHQAAWAVAGIDARATPLLRATRTEEAAIALPAPGAAESVLADYRATGLSLERHPLALLREQLAAYRVQPAAVLRDYPTGRLARASGLVTHRQRPGTAKGVVFVTLEDETGSVNVIVWPAVAEAQRKPLLGSTLLTVYGIWQREGEVRHLVARRLVDHTELLKGLQSRSRDFH
ncbi:error-prone DNA polymerase [Rubrivivax gelatinosus]|uniref:error-prone DNA polymerase n=3 Tax=Rubrivivax gelatinosus TaxID=28068 RepID=UPI0018C92AAA|nr:error-prone DNA polymerase [Rubrivivax gelatinosus]MBG6081260.1 error-prone DNA polymerase [Rubrivivax gelatinosus]